MYYFIARIQINDLAEYRHYLEKAEAVFKKYKGKYLAVDEHPVYLEGTGDEARTVVIQFNTRDDFEAWYYSPGYQEALQYRLRAADCHSVLVKGLAT